MGLNINGLKVKVEGKEIVRGLDLDIPKGKIVALMGPNGSGKSTLAYTLMGHPKYEVVEGSATMNGKDVLAMSVDERAKAGLFLSFQYPREITGVTLANFLRTAINSRREKPLSVLEFHKVLDENMKLLQMDSSFKKRYLNEGFSGGEKKRAEILQLAMLNPAFAILDETDSGLDIDAMKIVAEGVNTVLRGDMGLLVITHYQRLLNYIKPDFVHIMYDGRIIKSGDATLVQELEEEGYEKFIKEVSLAQ